MSRSTSYQYRLEPQRRREIRRREVAQMTQQYLQRYASTLADMSAQGLVRFVQTAYQQADRLCRQAESLCSSDPIQARELSRQVGQLMRGLPAQARRLRREEQQQKQQEKQNRLREERQRKIAEQRSLEKIQQDVLRAIPRQLHQAVPNALAAELVQSEMDAIQTRYSELAVRCGMEELEKLVEQFFQTLSDLKKVATERVATWEAETRREIEQEIMAATLAEQKEILASLATESIRKEMQAEIRKIESLETRIQRNETVTETECQQTLDTTREAAENIKTEEAVRRETLKSIIQTLRQVGFVIGEPLLRGAVVEISAVRPTGERCTFYVDINGGMEYHFDRYEGSACKKDIDTILPILQDVYGVHLSEGQTLWANPDRIDREVQWNARQGSRPIGKRE